MVYKRHSHIEGLTPTVWRMRVLVRPDRSNQLSKHDHDASQHHVRFSPPSQAETTLSHPKAEVWPLRACPSTKMQLPSIQHAKCLEMSKVFIAIQHTVFRLSKTYLTAVIRTVALRWCSLRAKVAWLSGAKWCWTDATDKCRNSLTARFSSLARPDARTASTATWKLSECL